MNANRFFSIPFDNRNDVTIRLLRANAGGLAAYGRWVSLLGMLYDAHGIIKLEYPGMTHLLMCELDFDDDSELYQYLDTLADLGLIDHESWVKRDTITNGGVCDELAYRAAKSYGGKKSGEARRAKREQAT